MKLGQDEIRYIKAFEAISGANAKDCILKGDTLTFLVPKKDMGQAIGKNGVTIQRARERMGKKIEIYEYANEPELFVKKAFPGVKFADTEIKETEKKTLHLSLDGENRRKMMARMGKLKKIREIAKREYGIQDIRIR